MKTIIVCLSEHHRSTKKIAEAMAAVLDAEVISPGEANGAALGGYELIGFGSGIAFGKHYKGLLTRVDALPVLDKNAFIFSTRGRKTLGSYHRALKGQLEGKGLTIVGEFSCRGFDTYGPLLKLIGGIARGQPNEHDLRDAQEFARGLKTGERM